MTDTTEGMKTVADLDCTRCGRSALPFEDRDSTWNLAWICGFLVEVICPSCQTPAEDLDAELFELSPNSRPIRRLPPGAYTGEQQLSFWVDYLMSNHRDSASARAAADRLAASKLAKQQKVYGVDSVSMVDLMRRFADAMDADDDE